MEIQSKKKDQNRSITLTYLNLKKAKKIVLISSLNKPVDDIRSYEKIGRSISLSNDHTVHLCGQESLSQNDSKITFHPIFKHSRLSLSRFLPQWKYAILLLKVKPNIIIFNTTELQLFNSLYKILFGAELYYNLEENYAKNIYSTKNFPYGTRTLLSLLTRLKERALHPLVKHYLVAENCYLKEMSFITTKATTILNKFQQEEEIKSSKKNDSKIHFIYTGTIAEQYGIFEVISFVKSAKKFNSNIELTIIGHCANIKTLNRVQKETINASFIHLIGGKNRVPHTQIINAISTADFALINYLPNPSTRDCFPTKIYEYCAHQLPIINLAKNTWSNHQLLLRSSFHFDLNTPSNFQLQLSTLLEKTYYDKGTPPNIYWKSEEVKLFKILGINKN